MERIRHIHSITKRLIAMTAIAVIVLGGIFALSFSGERRFMIAWAVLLCGIIGGFVSIQQRLNNVTDEELVLLDASWFQILLVPIFGGVFALVLYLVFLSGIVSGDLFPRFRFPLQEAKQSGDEFMRSIFRETYLRSGPDLAKLLFWSFVAGFSERFVPQLINNVTSSASSAFKNGKRDDAENR
ncbi:hypothetical protein EKK97_03705 [Billgrantia tianxiuensis]|uniref:Uncharacterized protein n=1 Tax=Billgrantia tianxiuensis TaxID=2497861 RepID=A0A6I6SLY0_9GAMM|nr:MULTISPECIES: hypothetical protein [Halomonas]MCE8033123.1 hypothetical protein [Halomonas sp. MCCC 1A11057]QHC48890.1 hypothetical protein EKK97_03705 [Halomonas tianxiuensis]